MEYKLKEPITKIDGEKIETVEIKEKYTGRDVKELANAKLPGDAVIKTVSLATSLSETVVLGMDARDVNGIAEKAASFLAGGES